MGCFPSIHWALSTQFVTRSFNMIHPHFLQNSLIDLDTNGDEELVMTITIVWKVDATKKQWTMKTKNSCQLSQQIIKLVFKYVCVVIANFNFVYSFFPNQCSYESLWLEQWTIIYTYINKSHTHTHTHTLSLSLSLSLSLGKIQT